MTNETASTGATSTDEWLVGTATAEITPDQPMWMAGYGARDGPSRGVHQDLHAKALVLEDYEGTTAVIVSIETLFVGRTLRAAVASRCKSEYGVDSRMLLMNASHTHMGPVTRTATTDVDDSDGGTKRVPKAEDSANFIPIEKYGVDESYRQKTLGYRQFLEDTIIDIVGQALSTAEPVTLQYSHGRCGSAMSRRRPGENGITFRPYADGPVDHDVPVLVATDPDRDGDEAIQALLFGYACHTTTQFIDEFSGDWAGYTQRFLEDRFPEATTLFLQGCGGDQKAYPQQPRDGHHAEDDQRYTKGHARAVALGVEAALESVQQPVRGPIRAVYEEIPLSFERPPSRENLEAVVHDAEESDAWRERHLLAVLDEHGEIPTEYPYPVQSLGFGSDLTLIALAGEVLVNYSVRLKEEIDGQVWVAGYSNNAFTYVPTRQALAEGGYEAGRVIEGTTLPGPWKPDIEERIVSKSIALAERVGTPSD